MKKIFIIRKFIAAETMDEAIKADKKTPVHEVYMDEHSTKQMSEELASAQKSAGWSVPGISRTGRIEDTDF